MVHPKEHWSSSVELHRSSPRGARKAAKHTAIGCLLGVLVTSMFFTMREAINQTQRNVNILDQASGVLPPNLLKCDCQETDISSASFREDHQATASSFNPPPNSGRNGSDKDDISEADDGNDRLMPEPRSTRDSRGGNSLINGKNTTLATPGSEQDRTKPNQQSLRDGSVDTIGQNTNAVPSGMIRKQERTRLDGQDPESRLGESSKPRPQQDPHERTKLPQNTSEGLHVPPEKSEVKGKKEPKEHIGEYITGMGVKDFDPEVPAVIATKVHGPVPATSKSLVQSICLLTKAYNDRVKYDIVVFTSVAWSEEAMVPIKQAAEPANLSFVVDNPGLKEMVDMLEPTKRDVLLKRCNATNSSVLTWQHRCYEKTSDHRSNERIAYNWQSEFRAKHLWNHPSVLKYKYMLWMDSDAFCTKVWKQDPIAAMVRHDLVLLFDHFPQGWAKGKEWPALFKDTFGKVICYTVLRNGTLTVKEGNCLGTKARLRQIHGFFHVTNLEFYRSAPVARWFDNMIGNTTFSRFYDDQIGVTMPAAAYASNRSWDMYYHGIKLDVVHNFLTDGRPWQPVGGFRGYWHEKNGSKLFPEADGKCQVTVAG